MADLSKKNVRGGGLPSSPFDWNSHTITTTNFGAFLPVKMVHLRAGDSIKGNVMQKSWLASLPAPVFGKFKNNTRAFFTKFTRIFKHYNDMLAGNLIKNPYTGGFNAISHVPYICGLDILKLFVDNCGFHSPVDITGDVFELGDISVSPSAHIKSSLEIDYYNNPNLLCYPCQIANASSLDYKFNSLKIKCDFKVNIRTPSNIVANPFGDFLNFYGDLGLDVEIGSEAIETNYVGFRFTRIGKLIYSLLLSLQYRFNLNWDAGAFDGVGIDMSTDEGVIKSLGGLFYPVSILPLLGYVRTYQDWVLPSRYYNNRVFVDWRYFNENIQKYGSHDWQPSPGTALSRAYPRRSVFTDYSVFGNESFPSASSLFTMLRDVLTIIVRSYYTEDYFMSSYSDMAEPGINYPSHLVAHGLDSDELARVTYRGDEEGDIYEVEGDTLVNPYLKSATIQTKGGENVYISQFSLLSVGRLQDMVLSGLIGGTKIQDWLKNEFGITPSKDSMMLTDYLGCDTQPVMIGDIYSQTTTKSDPDAFGNYLGEVGGRGIINTNEGFKIDYSTNEEGYLYIVHELVSVPFYYQGLTDDVLETGRYDFYNPRFDGIGFDPVSHLEMFNMPITIDEGAQTINPFGNKVFGFQPTYSRKKIPHDDLLGDFACPARNTDLLPWFVSRDFSRASKEGESSEMSQIIDMNWQSALADANVNDFDRIFYVNDGYNDPVRSLFVFNFTKYSHMLPIKQSFDFTSGKESITNSDGSVLTN